MIKRGLHLNQEFADPWMFPVLEAAQAAATAGRVPAPPSELGELSLYISTRFGMVERLAHRLSSEEDRLISAGKDHSEESMFTIDRDGYALGVDQALLYDFLIDLNSILFELTAVIDLFKCLLECIYKHIGVPVPKKPGKELGRLLANAVEDTMWFSRLNDYRNFFAHNGTPFIAIDISQEPWDILVMRRNVKTFVDPKDFFKLGEVNSLMQGFFSSRAALQRHFVNLYQAASLAPAGD